jgi:hypothetical protein
MQGELLTEGTFLSRPGIRYIDSPFEQKYIVNKNRAMTAYEVSIRAGVWGFDVRGYQDYGSFTLNMPSGIADGEEMLQDWYLHVRDMGKRSLKYKHIPTTLTDYDTLMHYINAYFYVVANLATLLNLNRLLQWNAAFSAVTLYLPRYMSRINRLWRRVSGLPMNSLVKAHSIRSGSIVGDPPRMAPIIRFWASKFLLAAGSGGPTITDIDATVLECLMDNTFLGQWVANLETVERWCEVGPSAGAPQDDFIAVRDAIDMTYDVVPGSFIAGLPAAKDLPGLSRDLSVLSDLLCKCVGLKDEVTSGTDTWLFSHIAEHSIWDDRSLVVGFGSPHPLYDFTLWGTPNFGIHNAGLDIQFANVDTAIRLPGTDFPLKDNLTLANWDIRDFFGQDIMGIAAGIGDDEIMQEYNAGTTMEVGGRFFNWGAVADIIQAIGYDAISKNHIFWLLGSQVRAGAAGKLAVGHAKVYDEAKYDYIFYPEAQDLGDNHAVLWQRALGIPYVNHATP